MNDLCPVCGTKIEGFGVVDGPSLADIDAYHEECAP